MELFTAGDESQMEVIKQWIDQSDVYLLILGGRYGSIEPKSGKSYTHIEYEYALSKGMPLFSCVLKNPDKRAKDKDNLEYIERDNPAQYKQFKKLVTSEKVVTFWEDTKDIKYEINRTLNDFARRDEIIGWVRGDQQVDAVSQQKTMAEMTRLSQENAELRERLNQQLPVTYAGLSYEELKEILMNKTVSEENFEQLLKLMKELYISVNQNYTKEKTLLMFFVILSQALTKTINKQFDHLIYSYVSDFLQSPLSGFNQLYELGLVKGKIFQPVDIPVKLWRGDLTLTQDGINFLNKMKSLNEINLDDILIIEENGS